MIDKINREDVQPRKRNRGGPIIKLPITLAERKIIQKLNEVIDEVNSR